MRILLVTSSSTRSGGARQALYLAEGLLEHGHQVTVFTPPNSTLRTLSDTMPWADLPEAPGRWKATLEAAMPAPGQGPCIVQAFHNKAVKRLAWHGLFWRRRGVVCVGYRGVVYRPGNPLTYWSPGLDAFVANSHACAKVLRGMGVGERRLAVIHNGIPAVRLMPGRAADAVRAELDLPAGSTLLGCVAGDKEVKGVDPLLRAFALACGPNNRQDGGPHLIVVGVTPGRWQPLCTELGITGRVRLVKHSNCVADYLQLLDAFVLPSLSESMPNTLLEAICSGLPVIASQVGGVPELVRGNGLLAPPGDVPALARALASVMDDAGLRATWAAASRAIAPDFSTDARVARYEALYRTLLQRRGLPDA
ncbi:glycosyltransferase family 4 protein [Nitratidesulfovibrio termitidis]|uniref:glycosyltransferase family 4 protein n=1 Tax=Nitratidesulfovibrio termitidis TaxID=42252 RepID=UPI000415CDB7|nr:glycosyltransferase family 4 protein [Nitratidesulfovibrio termitidis]